MMTLPINNSKKRNPSWAFIREQPVRSFAGSIWFYIDDFIVYSRFYYSLKERKKILVQMKKLLGHMDYQIGIRPYIKPVTKTTTTI